MACDADGRTRHPAMIVCATYQECRYECDRMVKNGWIRLGQFEVAGCPYYRPMFVFVPVGTGIVGRHFSRAILSEGWDRLDYVRAWGWLRDYRHRVLGDIRNHNGELVEL